MNTVILGASSLVGVYVAHELFQSELTNLGANFYW